MGDNTTTRIPYQQNNPFPYQQQQPIQVNQPVRIYKKNKKNKNKNKIKNKNKNKKTKNDVTYETPCNCIIGFIVVIFFIVGICLFSIILSNGISKGQSKTIIIAFIPLTFVIIAIILGSVISLYFIINISATSGIIIINKKKVCFCFSKQEVLQINDLQQVIVQTDNHCHHTINGKRYNSFEVIFRLSDGREVIGCSGIMNKDCEGRRAFQFIRNALPPRIVFGGNLAY